jgi:hypothetical protein
MSIRRREFTMAFAGLAMIRAAASQSNPMRLPKCLSADPKAEIDIDAHCHVFNGSDLQVERFLTLVASSGFSGLLKKVVELLAKPLQRSVWAHAPKAGKEIERLKKFPNGPQLKKDAAELLTPVYDDLARETTANYSESFAQELATPEGRDFLEAYRRYLDSMSARNPGAAQATLLLRTTEFERLRQPEGLIQQLEREKSLSDYSIASVFTFIRDFYAYRFEHCYYLLRNYGCEHGGVQLITPALVDYDYPLGAGQSPPPSLLAEQFMVMERISEVFQGRVLPYLAFDPWRIAEGHDPAPFKAAQDYVNRGAAVGFKIYPPMGFAPFANVDVKPAPGSWPNSVHFAEALDDALGQLWDFTTAADAPVLAHSGMSNAPYPDRVGLGAPNNWQKLFRDRRYSSARVCFGHFGGEGLLTEPDHWPAQFLDLVSKYQNAYGDIAYFEDVLSSSTETKLRGRLAQFVKQQDAVAKMVYGSDWVMLAIEAHAELYLEKMREVLSNEQYFAKDVPAKVFSLNAQQFLGLHRGQKTRMRVESFYAAHNVDAAWLKQIA